MYYARLFACLCLSLCLFLYFRGLQNPGIVDEGLSENILRDSCDPGAVGVIAAGGKLPFSRSANEMLGKFGVREKEKRGANLTTHYRKLSHPPTKKGVSETSETLG